MLLLIDGYNLLHQSDLLGRGRGERWLQKARERLLRQLVQQLGPQLCALTCVVFDAEAPLPGRPQQLTYQGIDVRYAVDYPEADDLLEELIAQHAAPSRLTVVSSDHRVQRAIARRRGAFFDADLWYARLLESGRPHLAIPWPPEDADDPQDALTSAADKPDDTIDSDEIAQWLKAFGLAAKPQRQAVKSQRQMVSKKAKSKPKPKPKKTPLPRSHPPSRSEGNPRRQLDTSQGNPFPDGYGEDLL